MKQGKCLYQTKEKRYKNTDSCGLIFCPQMLVKISVLLQTLKTQRIIKKYRGTLTLMSSNVRGGYGDKLFFYYFHQGKHKAKEYQGNKTKCLFLYIL